MVRYARHLVIIRSITTGRRQFAVVQYRYQPTDLPFNMVNVTAITAYLYSHNAEANQHTDFIIG